MVRNENEHYKPRRLENQGSCGISRRHIEHHCASVNQAGADSTKSCSTSHLKSSRRTRPVSCAGEGEMSNSNRVTCAGTTSNLKRKSFEALGEQLSSYLPSRRADCTQDRQERQDKKEIEEVNGIEEVQEGQANYEVTGDGQ